jgi:hypothetical protein
MLYLGDIILLFESIKCEIMIASLGVIKIKNLPHLHFSFQVL